MTTEDYVSLLNKIGMKNYCISYHHSLGDCSIRVYGWEIPSILSNMALMAIQGHSFSNVSIYKL